MSSAEPQYTWLWCDDNTKVTEWFLSEPDHHEYQFFYSSFINAANRAWSLISFKNAVLQPLDEDMISCLSLNPIPAETLIEVLKKYNRLIGGTRGDLKRKGLIKFGDAPPGKIGFMGLLFRKLLTRILHRTGCNRERANRAQQHNRRFLQEASQGC